MEVEFVTLGDASERLNVPSPTLRNWTDQLEEFQIHFVKRNNRNERVYYDNDLKIFEFVRDLKQEYGRKTTMRDIVNLIEDNADRFELRSQEEAPSPVVEPSNKTADLITADDMERLMENQRVRALIGFVTGETNKQLSTVLKALEDVQYQWDKDREALIEIQNQWDKDREALKEALREEVKKEIAVSQEQVVQELHTLKEEQKQRDEEEKERVAKRDAELMKSLKEISDKRKEDESKGFFAKIFGK